MSNEKAPEFGKNTFFTEFLDSNGKPLKKEKQNNIPSRSSVSISNKKISIDAPTREEFELRLQLFEKTQQSISEKNQIRMDYIESAQIQVKDEFNKGIHDVKGTYKWLIGIIIGTAAASVLAMAGLNYALFSNVSAAFVSGKNNADEINDLKANIKDLTEQLKKRKR